MFILWLFICVMILMAVFIIYWPARKLNYLFTMPLCLILSLGALGMYHLWGGSTSLSEYYQQLDAAEEAKTFLQAYGSVDEVIERFQIHLQNNSDDPQGWYLLGRLYLNNENFAQASESFVKANQLKPNDPQIMLQSALALYGMHGNDLQHEEEALLQKVLTLEPDNPDALNMLAWHAYQKQAYDKAIHYWEHLLDLLPAQSQARETILELIARADEALASTDSEDYR